MESQKLVPEINAVTCLLVFTFAICITGCESDKISSPAMRQVVDEELSDDEVSKITDIIDKVNASGTITDEQATVLSTAFEPATVESKKKFKFINLNGLTSITDKQAEILSKGVPNLGLDGLTSITDKQAESWSRFSGLGLDGLTSITDKQAKSLSTVKHGLHLHGLTSITDEQARILSKVKYLNISKACQPLVDEYRNP